MSPLLRYIHGSTQVYGYRFKMGYNTSRPRGRSFSGAYHLGAWSFWPISKSWFIVDLLIETHYCKSLWNPGKTPVESHYLIIIPLNPTILPWNRPKKRNRSHFIQLPSSLCLCRWRHTWSSSPLKPDRRSAAGSSLGSWRWPSPRYTSKPGYKGGPMAERQRHPPPWKDG